MIRYRAIKLTCVVLSMTIGTAAAFGAESPVDRMLKMLPDDVVGFVVIGGGDALQAEFDQSHIGRICNDPGVQSFASSIKEAILTKLQEEAGDEPVAEVLRTALAILKPAGRRPFVIGVARAKVTAGPPVYAFAALDAGPRKDEMTAALAKAEKLLAEQLIEIDVGSARMHSLKETDGVPLYWGWIGDNFVLALNDGAGAALTYLSKPRAVAPGYLSKLPGRGDAMAMYVDIRKAWSIVETFGLGHSEGDADGMKLAVKLLDKLGLCNVKSIAARAGFDGAELVGSSMLEVEGPRTGLLAAFKPTGPAMFDMVDARAMNASTFNCDLAGVYDTVMEAIKAASPDEGWPEVQQGIADIEAEMGLSIRNGLLGSLAGPVVSYSFAAGSLPEAPMGGFVVVAKLKDAKALAEAMTKLGEFAAAASEGILQISSQKLDDGKTINVWMIAPLAMMQVIPSWSIVDDNLVLGSNTALCTTAINHVEAKDAGLKSIRDTDAYKLATARVPANVLSLSYGDSRLQLNHLMMQLQQFWPMLTMITAQQGIKLPAVLPSISHITKDMGPSVQYSWLGPDGFYSYYRGPGTEIGIGAVAGGAVGAAIAMPALWQARGQAMSVASLSNLKNIGLALIMYADDHDGRFPDELQAARSYFGSSKVLESPRKPKGFEGESYIYINGQSLQIDSPATQILVYENPEFCEDKIAAVFVDGHAESMSRERFLEVFEQTYKRLGRPVPEIRFKGQMEGKPREDTGPAPDTRP
ncbi:MAG: hypothetical protein JSU94_21200 [Phycisphaerales bacterium]|nr:MAG: hypothetical protein JSU94_21200 [Phycisphaerales bacterium]